VINLAGATLNYSSLFSPAGTSQ